MSGRPAFARRHARRIAAVLIVVPLYAWARPAALPETAMQALAARFAFERHELPPCSGRAPRASRPVHPALERIEGWINVLGASVALCDLDGNGLPDDVVLSDPRTNEISVQPAPGSGARYAAFVLDPGQGAFDDRRMATMGCVPCDVNEDGWLDLLVYYWGRTPLLFLRRPGDVSQPSASAFVAREIAPGDERWYTNAAAFADLDGDGHLDLVVGNYFPDGASILDAEALDHVEMQGSMSRALNGGSKRLLCWRRAQGGDDPDVVFEDQSAALEPEVLHAWTLALGAADLDGDQLPELYFANDFGHDRLLHNRSRPGQFGFALLEGRKTFTMPSSKVVGRDSFKGMGVDFGDVNGDGVLDIYVSNITTEFGLEESQFLFASTGDTGAMRTGRAPYVDESEGLGLSRSGWAWDSKLADFDNDGVLEAQQALGFLAGDTNRWPELHEIAMSADPLIAAPGRWHRFSRGDDLSGHAASPFFTRGRDGRFHDIAARIGVDQHEVRRGIAVADIDGDGDLDFAVANQWCASAVYLNQSPHPGAALDLTLLLRIDQKPGDATQVRSGRPDPAVRSRAAIGALVHLGPGNAAPAAGSLPRAGVALVDGGNGHGGVRSPDVHLGLGAVARERPVGLDIAWRDAFGRAHRQSFELLPGRSTLYLGAEESRP